MSCWFLSLCLVRHPGAILLSVRFFLTLFLFFIPLFNVTAGFNNLVTLCKISALDRTFLVGVSTD